MLGGLSSALHCEDGLQVCSGERLYSNLPKGATLGRC